MCTSELLKLFCTNGLPLHSRDNVLSTLGSFISEIVVFPMVSMFSLLGDIPPVEEYIDMDLNKSDSPVNLLSLPVSNAMLFDFSSS